MTRWCSRPAPTSASRWAFRAKIWAGSHNAGDFVAWYNGHPDYRDVHFDLDCEAATVIGHGNVALDVARILAKTADELRRTDIASHALEALSASRVRDIHVVGRGKPLRPSSPPRSCVISRPGRATRRSTRRPLSGVG